MMRRAPLVVVLLLLASVGTASAECAWVLWFKMGGTVSDDASDWRPEDAFNSRETCVEKITRIKKQFDSDRRSTWYLLGTQSETSETRVSYRLTPTSSWDHARCLPASVDPRGPKTKNP